MESRSKCPFSGIEILQKPGDGITPVNPLGTCFDATAFQAVGPQGSWENRPRDLRICHGIGKTSFGKTRAHAWLEWRDQKLGLLIANDVIFQIFLPAKDYRINGRFHYVIEYTFDKFMELWTKHDYPGPWDRKIRKITEKVDAEINRVKSKPK